MRTTVSGIAPFVDGKKPGLHFLRALGWFAEADLEEPTAKTLAGGVHAPLSGDHRDALTALFKMRWSGLEKELTPEELSEFNRLCLPESPDFIVDQPDYYAFFTYSMFLGRAAE
ncbi:MAG: hypothetical protein GY866_15470 [Proteobacteria bacterium]|nr:hypothetical protein [Pseudomonadota bacterium]